MTTLENAPVSSEKDQDVMFYVAASSDPHATSGAILRAIRDGKHVTLRAVGAGAVNQTVKSVAIASALLPEGGSLRTHLKFEMIKIRGADCTAMVFDTEVAA